MPNEAHRPAALFVSVPQHRLEVAAIVAAVDPELRGPIPNHLRGGLFKGNTVHVPCEGEKFEFRNAVVL